MTSLSTHKPCVVKEKCSLLQHLKVYDKYVMASKSSRVIQR